MIYYRRILCASSTNFKFFSCKASLDHPIVAVTEGKLKGSAEKLLNGCLYYSFKGIPYAQPPVGDLRFKAPLPSKPWEGVREAMKHGAICPQYDNLSSSVKGNENCLFLNVYTTCLNTTAKLPVMVFLHGGAFLSSSGNTDSHGPDFLCAQHVIVVTINYRLEVLGFLCLDTPDIPGNAGMKDQVLALKWIKKNIEKFGGDPNNITLFGQSAGSAAVTYHMLSPMSQGLFNKAIAQSGVCTQDWAIGTGSIERAFRVGKVLGNNTNDPATLTCFLKTVPALDLKKMSISTRTEDEKFRGIPLYFVPVIEKRFDNVEAFMTEDPLDLLQSNKVCKVPFIIGYNSAEGLKMLPDQLSKTDVLNENPSYLLPKEIAHKLSQDQVCKMGCRVKRHYFGDKDISKESAEIITDVQTDRIFVYNIHRFAHFYSNPNEPTFMYKFDLVTDLNMTKKMLGYEKMKGVCHGDELFYLFCTPMTKDMYKKRDKIRDSVSTMTKLWTDFAKTGNPTQSTCTAWKPFTPSLGEYLLITEDLTPSTRPDCDRIIFWNTLYKQAGLPSIPEINL